MLNADSFATATLCFQLALGLYTFPDISSVLFSLRVGEQKANAFTLISREEIEVTVCCFQRASYGDGFSILRGSILNSGIHIIRTANT